MPREKNQFGFVDLETALKTPGQSWREILARRVNDLLDHLEVADSLSTVSAAAIFDRMTADGYRYNLLTARYEL